MKLKHFILPFLMGFASTTTVHSYAQCNPDTPPITPQYSLGGRTITASNVSINGGGATAFVNPGSTFTVGFNWDISSNITACPGCITIFHFGLSNVSVPGSPGGATTYPNTHCMGSVYAGMSSYSSGTFTAPTEPGYYYITLVSKWVYWCHQYSVNHCNNAKIARIQVGIPTEVQIELDTLSHVSGCNTNDGIIGINIISPNDYGCYATYWTGPDGFDAANQTTISNLAPGDYQVVVTPITGCAQTFNFTINNNACNPCITQQIDIDAGWNIISSYIYPEAPDLTAIFSEVLSDIVIVKNISGQVFLPGVFNQIGDWDIEKGYQVKAINATSISMECSQVDPSTTPIILPSGWSNISYLRDHPMDANIAWEGILDDIQLAKDENGKVFLPNVLNQIGDLKPGEGYQIKIETPTTLYYPAND